MCGIVGIAGVMPVNQSIYDALTVLQHRGQDARNDDAKAVQRQSEVENLEMHNEG
nr:purF protein (EC 2.4.2.14) incomplete coding sequenc-1.35 kb gap [Escherichia coli]